MELTRDLLGKRVRLCRAVFATALCAGLVAPASASAANLSDWTAVLPLPPGFTTAQSIDFKVKSKKDKQTKKFRPVAIKKLDIFFLKMNCTDSEPAQTSLTWGQLKTLVPDLPEQIPVSNRRFSLSATGGGPVNGGNLTFTLTFSGRVPRNGPPNGTLRYTASFPRFTSDPNDPNAPGTYVQVSCDSSTLSWTAHRSLLRGEGP
jgi:hypothetical protein